MEYSERLGLLQSEAETWRVPEPGKLRRVLVNSGSDSTSVEQMNNTELTYAICCYLRSTLSNTKRLEPGNPSHALDALQQSRDKVIAHTQSIDSASFQSPTWGDATSLLNYAKQFVTTIGLGYLGLHFEDGSDSYSLSHGARRTSNSLRRLLRAADIIEGSRF